MKVVSSSLSLMIAVLLTITNIAHAYNWQLVGKKGPFGMGLKRMDVRLVYTPEGGYSNPEQHMDKLAEAMYQDLVQRYEAEDSLLAALYDYDSKTVYAASLPSESCGEQILEGLKAIPNSKEFGFPTDPHAFLAEQHAVYVALSNNAKISQGSYMGLYGRSALYRRGQRRMNWDNPQRPARIWLTKVSILFQGWQKMSPSSNQPGGQIQNMKLLSPPATPIEPPRNVAAEQLNTEPFSGPISGSNNKRPITPPGSAAAQADPTKTGANKQIYRRSLTLDMDMDDLLDAMLEVREERELARRQSRQGRVEWRSIETPYFWLDDD